MFQWANYVEAGFWLLCAAFVLLTNRNDSVRRRSRIVLAAALAAFGVSDVVEVQTGAWWKPWWLLGWKGLCLIVILATIARLARSRTG